jgi:hypothetical protein
MAFSKPTWCHREHKQACACSSRRGECPFLVGGRNSVSSPSLLRRTVVTVARIAASRSRTCVITGYDTICMLGVRSHPINQGWASFTCVWGMPALARRHPSSTLPFWYLKSLPLPRPVSSTEWRGTSTSTSSWRNTGDCRLHWQWRQYVLRPDGTAYRVFRLTRLEFIVSTSSDVINGALS